jgi:hypothetical protein
VLTMTTSPTPAPQNPPAATLPATNVDPAPRPRIDAATNVRTTAIANDVAPEIRRAAK